MFNDHKTLKCSKVICKTHRHDCTTLENHIGGKSFIFSHRHLDVNSRIMVLTLQSDPLGICICLYVIDSALPDTEKFNQIQLFFHTMLRHPWLVPLWCWCLLCKPFSLDLCLLTNSYIRALVVLHKRFVCLHRWTVVLDIIGVLWKS